MDKNRILDPLERELRRRRRIVKATLVIALLAVAWAAYWFVFAEIPRDYDNPVDHFKYGSIGSETSGGLPLRLWEVLPAAFPEHLPDPDAYRAIAADRRTPLDGYRQFGFVTEPDRPLPIGFSVRRRGAEWVGLNCAVCHVGTIRVSDGLDPDRIYRDTPLTFALPGIGEAPPTPPRDRAIVLGMPANTVNLTAYFEFLFDCARDPRFTVNYLMAQIEADGSLGPVKSLFYRQAIPAVREGLLTRRDQLSWTEQNPPAGPGRIDTFNPYWTMIFNYPWNGTNGIADFPSIWNQRPRDGMQLHWDGNNTSVLERNLSAAFGAGATPVSVDLHRMKMVADWIGSPEDRRASPEPDARRETTPRSGELEIPRFPFPIDEALAARGREIYFEADSDPSRSGVQSCASCHDFEGQDVGKVVSIDAIGTDRHRLDSFTEELVANQNTLGIGHPWRFHQFRKTHGYANHPLDGLWARAPYLHNGSVPTLRDLLEPPERRPKSFYRGDDEYDPVRVGFRSDRDTSGDGRRFFLFEVGAVGPSGNGGNGNGGHRYGLELDEADKDALVEYLKTEGGGDAP
ncbi:cytochrome c [Tautonia sp. JC769]|uniref:c-type cytochrome n=1 Tax=Tautonia sp. JC769 TaxID=3232135 RepID=UPI00345A1376